MRILVVDENATGREMLRTLLTSEGHSTVEAEHGLAALKLLQSDEIDAVISDILMPIMDGYRLCYEIRKRKRLRGLPFIIYTATYTSPSDEKLALEFGADKFIRKPASPAVITKAVREVMEDTKGRRTKRLQEPDKSLVMREYSQVLVRKLEEKSVELAEANKALEERARLAAYTADLAHGLTHKGTQREMLQLCTEAMVRHLEAAFARIWTYNRKQNVLELQASAGMYTHIDGGHSRVAVGQSEIGVIASAHKPHLTNNVIGDARVHDQEWAKREGMVAFAGYPLLVDNRLVGVMAMFARRTLSQNALDAMAAVAEGIAMGIEQKQTEDELRQSEERFRELAENIHEIFFVSGPKGRPVYYVSPAYEQVTGRNCNELYRNPLAWLENLHPEDRPRLARALQTNPENLDEQYRILKPDGETRWLRSRAFPVRDAGGEVVRIVGIVEEITERKLAEQKAQRNLDRIRALHEIDLAITSTLDLRGVLEVLLEKIEIFLPYPAAITVRLLNRETGILESLACRGLSEEEWTAQDSRTLGGRAKTIVETKAPLTVRNVQTDPGTSNPEIFRKYGLVSHLGVPLIAKGETLGVLGLYTKQDHEFSQGEIEFLNTLASQAAIAIHNARLHETLRTSRDELAKANKIKDDFLSVMSHELRTPLIVIMGYARLLKDRTLGEINQKQQKALEKMLGSAGDQLDIVNTLLQTTLLDADAVVPAPESVDVRGLLNSLNLEFEFQANNPKVGLTWDYPAELLQLTTDTTMLKQLLHNLINNAIKFTDQGTVTVSAVKREDGRKVEFKVADTGVGIPTNKHAAIFDKLYQVDSSDTRLYGGVGLGLYIVKRYTELLGGTVEVESQPGKGSTFTVTLPSDYNSHGAK